MYCYKCAKEIPEASAYCPICGAKLESKGIKLSGDAELKYVIENLGREPVLVHKTMLRDGYNDVEL